MITKKLIIGIALAVSLILQVGCAGQEGQNNLKNNESVNQETSNNLGSNSGENSKTDAEKDTKQENGIMDDFNLLAQKENGLSDIIKFMDENISKVSKENASTMINKLEEAQNKNLPKLEEKFYSDNKIQSKMAEIFKEDFDIDKVKNSDDEELKDIVMETKDTGYKIETAEGMFFPIVNYDFYKKYSSYATDDVKDYMDIMSVESSKVPANDGALVIGWDEVLNRVLKQEKFINLYPDSSKTDDVKKLYKKYVTFALFGLNNTPLFSYDSNTMVEEAKNIYTNTIENNKNSEFINTLKEYMDILKKNDYKLTDEADKFRKNVVENMQ